MPVVSHGVDLIDCKRVAAMMKRHPERFLTRILTPRERDYVNQFRNATQRVAGRFAAKEAILKMLGTGWVGRIAWTDMEILNNPAGAPQVALSGECARIAGRLGISRILLSITHTADQAMASAIGVDERKPPEPR
jgi:holo-[acyl-carrier protein] synthase